MTESRWDPQPNTEVLVPERYPGIQEWTGAGDAWGILGARGATDTWVVTQGERLSVLSREGGAVVRVLYETLRALKRAGVPAQEAAEKAAGQFHSYVLRGVDLADLSADFF